MRGSRWDTSAFVEPVDMRAARSAARTFWRTVGNRPSVAVTVALAAVAALALLVVVAIGIGLALIALTLPEPVWWVWAIPAGFAVIGTLLIVAFVRSRHPRTDAQDARWYRLSRFAAANGAAFVPLVADPPLPSTAFRGHERVARDVVRWTSPRPWEVGNHQSVIGRGESARTEVWGYVAITLAHPLPHIVLDARANDPAFGSNLPQGFAESQRLSLEGDLDGRFRLYCPTGYERDALYLFTPDVLALLIDHASSLDVEIVDSWLFFLSNGPLSTTDAERWASLQRLFDAISAKLGQWERWRDDNAQTLAPPMPGAVALGVDDASPAGRLFAEARVSTPSAGRAWAAERLRRSPGKVIAGIVLPVLFVVAFVAAAAFLDAAGVLPR